MTGVQELGFRATSLPTLVQMVSSGAGVTLLPRLALPLEQSRAELSVRAFAAPAPRRTLVLAWRRRSVLADPLRQIAAVIRSVYPATVSMAAAVRAKPGSTRPRRTTSGGSPRRDDRRRA